MLIEIPCQQCGHSYVPSRTDVLRGPACYRVCPRCRATVIAGPPAPHVAPVPTDTFLKYPGRS